MNRAIAVPVITHKHIMESSSLEHSIGGPQQPGGKDHSGAEDLSSDAIEFTGSELPETGFPESNTGALVILTGLSGSGKGSALRALEDLGYHAVDNLPIDLLPDFAELVATSAGSSTAPSRAAIVIDVREGATLERFPVILSSIRERLSTTVVYLEATRAALLRRFSETRRPHPLGRDERVEAAMDEERRILDPIRNVADVIVDTSSFNVHELRAYIQKRFSGQSDGKTLLVSAMSFGYKNGVPLEADLVFDVRFLPNPHFIPEFRPLTGLDPEVKAYVQQFRQTTEFLERVTSMLLFLLPHYINEGKSYLTVAFGCTGGQHRSVAISEEVARRLGEEDYKIKTTHRDMPR